MNKKPTVYVVTETGNHNITPAMEFGNIEVILPPRAQITFSVVPTINRIKRALAKFSDDDYLLFIGDPVAIAAVSSVAASRNNGRYKCLKWDKFERRYIPIQIDLYPQKGESHESDEYL